MKSLPAGDELIVFNGICDGSAAVKLDDETILVAYDELNSLFSFHISGGMPIASVDLSTILNLKNSDEIDLEAAVLSGQQIWWLGSHSSNKRAGYEANRHMLFATSIPAANLSNLQLVYPPIDLLPILLKSKEVEKLLTPDSSGRAAKEGGLNIEGLAAAADGALLVGFRSPLSEPDRISGKAMVVRIAPVAESFEVQYVKLLELGDRGIRDIVADGDDYVIIAGPVAAGGKFSLFTWDGYSQPVQNMDLPQLNAEGLVVLDNYWMILSDDGKLVRENTGTEEDDSTCDRVRSNSMLAGDHPEVFFRARKVWKLK